MRPADESNQCDSNGYSVGSGVNSTFTRASLLPVGRLLELRDALEERRRAHGRGIVELECAERRLRRFLYVQRAVESEIERIGNDDAAVMLHQDDVRRPELDGDGLRELGRAGVVVADLRDPADVVRV